MGEVHDAPVTVERERDENLESLYVEHADRLWRALYAYAGDPEVASDALAEAFAQYMQRGTDVRWPARWIWRAAFRIAAGELKERRMERPAMPVNLPAVPQPTWELLSVLRHLPPRQRAALVLHYYAGYKAREIADILGSTSATVRVHLSQGRKRLRSLLEGDRD
jgi:DNA-directed RNA polymerase specialized sigma24 family protein